MEVEKQVWNLELAKRLKELGVKQQSAFRWEQIKVAGKNEWNKDWTLAFNNYSKPYDATHIVSAFTIGELGEMLPIQINTQKPPRGVSSDLFSVQKGHFENGTKVQWQVMYYDGHFENADTEADARARMLVYLLEHNLVSM